MLHTWKHAMAHPTEPDLYSSQQWRSALLTDALLNTLKVFLQNLLLRTLTAILSDRNICDHYDSLVYIVLGHKSRDGAFKAFTDVTTICNDTCVMQPLLGLSV